MMSSSGENVSTEDLSRRDRQNSATQFNVPPKPILNKSDHQLPKLQTNPMSNAPQQRPAVIDSTASALTTPITQTSSSHSTPQSMLKHTNSISFNVPSTVEKSHRGSISARPSAVNVSNGYPKLASPSAPSHQQQAQNSRQPSSTQVRAVLPSTSSSITNTQAASQHSHPQSQQDHHQVSSATAGVPNTVSTVHDRRTSPSPYSSRQGSSNGEYLQFFAKSHDATHAHYHPTLSSAINDVAGSDSRTNSISSVASYQSPIGSDFSDAHALEPVDTLHMQAPAGAQPLPAKKLKIPSQKTVVASPTGPIVPFTQYLQREDDNKIHILIGATGSVATIKVPLIIDKLQKIYGADKVSIQLVVTKPAEHFLRGSKISTEVKIWRDSDEWSNTFGKPGDPILHVELRKWADIFLIAPLSANTLAKISNGLCDNLLTSIVRSWNPTIPILAAPAMNTLMYTHPMTKKHLNILAEDFKFVTVLKPVEKVLVCGDIGMGGMREWTDIVDTVMRKIKLIKAAKAAELAEAQGIAERQEEEEEEEEDDDDEDDEDYEDDEEYDSDSSTTDSSDADDDDEDQDDFAMELDNVSDKMKGSVDNLGTTLQHSLSLTGDPVKDHRFTSTTDLI